MVMRKKFVAAGPRRQRVWARLSFTSILVGASATSFQDLLTGYKVVSGQIDFAGYTIARMRVSMLYAATSGVVVELIPWGILVGPSSLDNVDIGPVEFPYLDWMAYGYLKTGSPTFTERAGTDAVDIRSMRRINELQENLWLGVQQPATVGNTTEIHWGVDILLLKP